MAALSKRARGPRPEAGARPSLIESQDWHGSLWPCPPYVSPWQILSYDDKHIFTSIPKPGLINLTGLIHECTVRNFGFPMRHVSL